MDELKQKKYKYVKNMLSSDMIEFLSTYCLKRAFADVDHTTNEYGMPSSVAFHSATSDLFNHILHFLLPVMEKETNLKLKPTYSYNRIYLPGADLEKHSDRPSCEYSASITLKYFYKNENYKWPLCMNDLPIIIEKGDGVIYKGCDIEHWRPIFVQPDGSWHHQVFLHYVDLNGPYKDFKEELGNERNNNIIKNN